MLKSTWPPRTSRSSRCCKASWIRTGAGWQESNYRPSGRDSSFRPSGLLGNSVLQQRNTDAPRKCNLPQRSSMIPVDFLYGRGSRHWPLGCSCSIARSRSWVSGPGGGVHVPFHLFGPSTAAAILLQLQALAVMTLLVGTDPKVGCDPHGRHWTRIAQNRHGVGDVRAREMRQDDPLGKGKALAGRAPRLL